MAGAKSCVDHTIKKWWYARQLIAVVQTARCYAAELVVQSQRPDCFMLLTKGEIT